VAAAGLAAGAYYYRNFYPSYYDYGYAYPYYANYGYAYPYYGYRRAYYYGAGYPCDD
jgi:hypothetical protein